MGDTMKLTKPQPSSEKTRVAPTRTLAERRRAWLTKAGGWIALVFGAAHVIIAPLESRRRDVWSEAADEGWWNTFTLEEATTLAEFERSHAFWVSLGSWGVPVLVLGCYVVWSARQRQRVPGWIGWIMLAWSLPFVTALPASPGWLFAVSGALIVLGDRRGGRAVTGAQRARVIEETGG
jgi:Family of unknown function (DUF6463)